MTDMYAHVSVRILEKEYQVACPANERDDLLDSAEVLNTKMLNQKKVPETKESMLWKKVLKTLNFHQK